MTGMTVGDEELAQQTIGLLELTSLNVDDTPERIIVLCQRALTPFGPVAAVCVAPRFAGLARRTLDSWQARDIKVVAAINFPGGTGSVQSVESETQAALMAGADEIDLVYPFRAQLAGNKFAGAEMVAACKEKCDGRADLTVTLETGVLRDPQVIHDVCRRVIQAGPAFIKTSTGKVAVNATPQASRIMVEAIAEVGGQVGFKAAGGVRTLAEARIYLDLVRARFGPLWLEPGRLRIGAASLLDDLLLRLGLCE
ncbi:MAG TPA: deoxyribose-phosphate aldolase [Pseudomonas sp.]|uniref:deoxyribose-phosphate aldolase n=1 Tax=Pseudomonas sp. TaxID=306 RepID=UPI002EDAAB4A